MLRALCLLLLAAAAACAASFRLTPDLITAMPWTDSPDGVRVAAPFLVNPNTIVPAGSTIRLFYVRPAVELEGQKARPAFDYGDNRSESVNRMGTGIQPSPAGGDSETKIPRALKKTLDTAHSTVWPNLASFRSALQSMEGADMRVVYQQPGSKSVSDETFGLLEGLLLSEKDDHVVIQAVRDQSDAAQAGLQAGDRILLLNGQETPTLAAFLDIYRTVRDSGNLREQKPYLFHILHSGATAPVDISLEPPISLSGSLLDQ
ncbi:MAG: PDZ domain-containing protein [Verrucomicrobium sp.]|nr:PDZ domain-containing protein [Verrucomicrobium sp.]